MSTGRREECSVFLPEPDDSSAFAIECVTTNGSVVVRPAGELDIATSPQLRTCLDRCDGDVVLDLQDVTFVDSSGLGVIALTSSRLRDVGSFRVRNPQDNVRRTMEAVRMEQLIKD